MATWAGIPLDNPMLAEEIVFNAKQGPFVVNTRHTVMCVKATDPEMVKYSETADGRYQLIRYRTVTSEMYDKLLANCYCGRRMIRMKARRNVRAKR